MKKSKLSAPPDERKPVLAAAGMKEIRRRYGWSVVDLAERLGVSPRTIENWEQRRFKIPGPALKILGGLMKINT